MENLAISHIFPSNLIIDFDPQSGGWGEELTLKL